MEASETPDITPQDQQLRELHRLFGDYKAEWLREKVYELFTEPSYFPMLEGPRPCILTGGRGTGKTSVLKGMSYEGQFYLRSSDPLRFAEWPQIGLYYRINSNRAAIFRGNELSDENWSRLFAHYLNLIFCDLILEFVEWYRATINSEFEINADVVAKTAQALGCSEPSSTSDELRQSIKRLMIDFELVANNIADQKTGILSAPGAPIDELTQGALSSGEFGNITFAFLLDEYENLDEPQQRVLNTLLKHSGESYTFKIGAKQGGLRTRRTLAPDQDIQDPADFALVDVTAQLLENNAFSDFAEQVCDSRLGQISLDDGERLAEVTQLFVSLTTEQEAKLQGVSDQIAPVREELLRSGDPKTVGLLAEFHDYELYVLWRLNGSTTEACSVALQQAARDIGRWKTQYANYRQAYLYTMKRRKVGIRKYYAGWQTVVQLASGNIRLLMELVESCFVRSAQLDAAFGQPFMPELQTMAFVAVGRKNLTELNANREGARLFKLLLGLGRVFGVLASDPDGHAPEITQFTITEESPTQIPLFDRATIGELIEIAIMELVLVRQPGTKLGEYDIKDYEYRIHPVYSPFFAVPAGRKRRVGLTPNQVLQLAESPKSGVASILGRLRRDVSEPLPDQLITYSEVLLDGDQ
jgi:hypothetical protein